MKPLFIFLVCIQLTGCSQPRGSGTIWYKAGASDSDLAQAIAEARYHAETASFGAVNAVKSPFASTSRGPGEAMANGVLRAFEERRLEGEKTNLIKMYLEMKGWREVPIAANMIVN